MHRPDATAIGFETASGALFWLRLDAPIEALLPPRRKQDAGEAGPKRPLARAGNSSSTGGYGYSVKDGGIAVFNINGIIAPSRYAVYEDDAMTVSDMLAADVRA